jgi:hypothetical protein
MKSIKRFFSYLWKDNVWSKVIASIIFASLVAIFLMVRDYIIGNSIGTFYSKLSFKLLSYYEGLVRFLLRPFNFYNWSVILLIMVIFIADKSKLTKYLLKIIASALRGPVAHGFIERDYCLSNSESNKAEIGTNQIIMCDHIFKVKPTFSAKVFHMVLYFNYERDSLNRDLQHLFRFEIEREDKLISVKKLDGKSGEILESRAIFNYYQNEEFEIHLGYVSKEIKLGIEISCENQTVYNSDIASYKYFHFVLPDRNLNNVVNVHWVQEYWS